MKRKEFIKKSIKGSGLILITPALLYQSCDKEEDKYNINRGNSNISEIMIDLNDPANSALKNKGGTLLVNNGNIILINNGNDEYIALSTICTHQSCTVKYNSSNNILSCPCHGSIFSAEGSVLNGPANSPLRKYNVSITDSILHINN